MHLGLVLLTLPGPSETFINSKINGLISNGFKISLFLESDLVKNHIISGPLKIYYQPNRRKIISMPFFLLRIIFTRPSKLLKFIKSERASKKNWKRILKNILINYHFFLTEDIDWIHFEFATLGINRENIGKSIGAKTSCSFRGQDISLFPSKNPGCYELLFKKIDKIHTISDDLYAQAIKLGLDSDVKFEKITPAIDTGMFSTRLKEEKVFQPIKILTTGRLHWKKGYEYAIDALKIIHDNGIDFEYRIIGNGDYFEPIMYSVIKLGLKDKVKFLGKKPHEEVIKQMEWADIYIQPSIQEGFCNSVIEAQSMGLLIIVTNAEGLSENISNNKTGWIIQKRNPKALSNKLSELLNLDIKEIIQIRKNARERAVSKFSISDQAKLFNTFYKNF
jgi:colanic acid/amylovoran biosynthesis glycosyltransferase